MSKGMVFVVGYSIFLLILFCTMCYLMTTVNPPPLTIVETHKANGTRRFLDLNLKPLIVDTLATGDKVEYGLDKVRDDELLTSRTYPLYNIYTRQIDGFNGPDILESETVIPPIWPPRTEPQDIIHLPIIIVEGHDSNSKIETPIKSHRRSVNNDQDNSESSIIFKVVHNSNRPRIEIKLSNGIKKNITINKFNPKFGLSIPSDNDGRIEKHQLSDNNVIKIMSNDTVVIYDGGNPTETGEMDHVHDIKTSKDNIDTFFGKVNSNNKNSTRLSTEYSNNEMNLDILKKPQRYDLNIGVKDANANVQNVISSNGSLPV